MGFLLGYLGTIPAAGPLAMLVVLSALAGQRRRSALLAAGGAVAEGLWAAGAASGLGWVLGASPRLEHGLRLGGSALAIVMGLLMALLPAPREPGPPRERAASALLAGFLLVALNPSFLATWLASCAVLRAHPSVASVVSPPQAPWLGLGAALGVLGWFLTLGALLERFRERLAAWQRGLGRALGWALVAVGVVGLTRG